MNKRKEVKAFFLAVGFFVLLLYLIILIILIPKTLIHEEKYLYPRLNTPYLIRCIFLFGLPAFSLIITCMIGLFKLENNKALVQICLWSVIIEHLIFIIDMQTEWLSAKTVYCFAVILISLIIFLFYKKNCFGSIVYYFTATLSSILLLCLLTFLPFMLIFSNGFQLSATENISSYYVFDSPSVDKSAKGFLIPKDELDDYDEISDIKYCYEYINKDDYSVSLTLDFEKEEDYLIEVERLRSIYGFEYSEKTDKVIINTEDKAEKKYLLFDPEEHVLQYLIEYGEMPIYR